MKNVHARLALGAVVLSLLGFAPPPMQQPQVMVTFTDTTTGFPNISRWDGAFDMSDPMSPAVQSGFPRNNDSTFRFRVNIDPGPNGWGNPNARDEILATLRTVGNWPTPDYERDSIVNIPLTETGNNTLEFELGRLVPAPPPMTGMVLDERTTRPFILVSNAVDDNWVPPDNTVYDRTLRGRNLDRLRAEYDTGYAEAMIPVRAGITFIAHIMRPCEPYVDSGVQNNGLQGAGNGRFTFIDSDNDMTHDSGETCESVIEHHRNNDRWDVDPAVVDSIEVLNAWEQMDRTWTQVGVFFGRQGDYDIRETPGQEPWDDLDENGIAAPSEIIDYNGNGRWDPAVDIMENSYLTVEDNNQQFLNLVDTDDDNDPRTVDLFVVNAFSNPLLLGRSVTYGFGAEFNPYFASRHKVVVGVEGLGHPFVCSHEMGHLLFNMGDTPTRTWLMTVVAGGDTVTASKRIPMDHLSIMLVSMGYQELTGQ